VLWKNITGCNNMDTSVNMVYNNNDMGINNEVNEYKPMIYDGIVSNYTFSTCPRGFVLPENPASDGVSWVAGTPCALSCARSPFSTKELYDDMYSFSNVAGPVAVLILSLTSMILLSKRGERWRMNYLFVVFFLTQIPLAATNVASHIINFRNNGAAFCVDNAIPYNSNRKAMLSMCLIQAVMTVYFQVGSTVTFVIITLDIGYNFIFSSSTIHLVKFYLGCIGILPLIAMMIVFGNSSFGYISPSTTCLSGNVTTPIVLIPVVLLAAALICILCTIYVSLSRAWLVWKKYTFWTCIASLFNNLLSPAFLFSIMTFTAYCVLTKYRGSYNIGLAEAIKLMPDHIQCIFTYYDGVSDESWLSVCGEGIAELNGVMEQRFDAYFFFYSQSIFFMMALIPAYLKKCFISFYLRVLLQQQQSSGHVSSLTDNTALTSRDYRCWRIIGWILYCCCGCRARESVAPVPSNDSELYEYVAELFHAKPGDVDANVIFLQELDLPRPIFKSPFILGRKDPYQISTNLDPSGAAESEVAEADHVLSAPPKPFIIEPLTLLT
jgi:hypothetical protein